MDFPIVQHLITAENLGDAACNNYQAGRVKFDNLLPHKKTTDV